MIDAEHAPGRTREVDQPVAVGDVRRHRLVDHDMPAGAQCGFGVRGVEIVGRDDDDKLDRLDRKQRIDVGDDPRPIASVAAAAREVATATMR